MTLEVSDGKAFFTAEFKHEAVRLVLERSMTVRQASMESAQRSSKEQLGYLRMVSTKSWEVYTSGGGARGRALPHDTWCYC